MSESVKKPSEKLIAAIKTWVQLDDRVRRLKEEMHQKIKIGFYEELKQEEYE
jgi:hypothetical protein